MVDNNVSHCVIETTKRTQIALTDTSYTKIEYTWINNCGFTVNLSTAFLTSSTIETISLASNETHSDSTIAIPIKFVACRPPSTGIDVAPEEALLQFGCS
ncbi:hypothetical protein DFR28_102550 [Arenicella xantha]|uniref:Uncharacterized protein n=1 Tax=Arenicella xantha TaxID=644221 RepID=A0A395JKB7_9GAMM|nr:hypothetical protein DFR28_102550 [Arenicella xantha]